jgi:hypothetical protein
MTPDPFFLPRAHLDRYEPYWAEEPLFDCRNTLAAVPHLPCPPIDADCLRRLIDFAVRDRWGMGARKPRGESSLSGKGRP